MSDWNETIQEMLKPEAQGNGAMEPVAWLEEHEGEEPHIHIRGSQVFNHIQAYPHLHDSESLTALVPASSIASLSEKLAEAERERDEARQLVTEANNSLYGSQGYFHSLNGGAFDKYHLATGIEKLKDRSRKQAIAEQENAELRAIISKCCNALPNGAFCSPKASLEFMAHVPAEIQSVIQRLSAKLAEARAAAFEEVAQIADSFGRWSGFSDPQGDAERNALTTQISRAIRSRAALDKGATT